MSGLPAELGLTIDDGIAWVTFNRPQKANALTIPMLQGLEQILDRCAGDDAVRALVLTGAGTRAFSAGADLAPAPGNDEDFRAQRRTRFAAALLALVEFSKPTVAAVNGAACGYGMMLALVCDVAVAAAAARFALPEINKGTPTLAGISILSQRFGSAIAADLVLSGRFMDADEALRRGLVRQVVAGAELPQRAREQALALSRHDALAYARDKQWLNRPLRDEIAAATRASAALHQAATIQA